MNRSILLLLLLYSGLTSAQVVVNGKDINKLPDVEYIELIQDQRPFMQRQVFAVIDYGQTIRWLELRLHRIQDENGGDKLFGSEMDIFNFLHRNGWVHETTYARESCVYHIFRRQKAVPAER
ncbi:hypothetical protein [Spirosoma montaniterrae]|uniref:Uncharacterized protein n=1 Tax=Spirosoma montaniterrae TaxID=1178516 RepID=A0A1P9WXJ9_9BACT|nr:hypothetical protein [Spirosoma montaniterrae]AQG80105.1 hypothetical protein AWR27_12670 [Spirosoma montaniterrae]